MYADDSREFLSLWQECDDRLNFHNECEVRHPRVAVIHGFAKQGTNNCLSASSCNDEPSLPCLNCCTKGKFETLSGIWTPELKLRNESRKTRIWLLYVYTIVSGLAETPK